MLLSSNYDHQKQQHLIGKSQDSANESTPIVCNNNSILDINNMSGLSRSYLDAPNDESYQLQPEDRFVDLANEDDALNRRSDDDDDDGADRSRQSVDDRQQQYMLMDNNRGLHTIPEESHISSSRSPSRAATSFTCRFDDIAQVDMSKFVNSNDFNNDPLAIIANAEASCLARNVLIQEDARFQNSHIERENSWEPSIHNSPCPLPTVSSIIKPPPIAELSTVSNLTFAASMLPTEQQQLVSTPNGRPSDMDTITKQSVQTCRNRLSNDFGSLSALSIVSPNNRKRQTGRHYLKSADVSATSIRNSPTLTTSMIQRCVQDQTLSADNTVIAQAILDAREAMAQKKDRGRKSHQTGTISSSKTTSALAVASKVGGKPSSESMAPPPPPINNNNKPSKSNNDTHRKKVDLRGGGSGRQESQQRSSMKRDQYISWEEYFMAVACLASQRSKDPMTQVGTVIVNDERKIVGVGYNGMPNGCDDDTMPWARDADSELDTKYPFVCHAEMNAIINKNAASVTNCTLYSVMFPCNECAKLIIQSGIRRVIYMHDKPHKTAMIAARQMFDRTGIEYRYNDKAPADYRF